MTPTNDTLCTHVAGLVQAFLNAEWGANRVVEAYPHPIASLNASRCPCVVVTRAAEDLTHYPGRRYATVTVQIDYYAGAGKGAQGQRGVPWGDVWLASRWIDRAIQDGSHSTYQTGQHLSDLAGVLERGTCAVTYPAPPVTQSSSEEEVYPSVSLRYTLSVRDVYERSAETLKLITVDINQPFGSATTQGVPVDVTVTP